jgi:hypothetical protein
MSSPEKVAVTSYVPGVRVTDVWQLNAGNVTVQSVNPPEVNVTIPVAPAGRPLTETVS